MRTLALLLLLLLSAKTATAGDTLQADSTKKARHSSAFLSIGGPLSFSFDYAYRILPKKTDWLAFDIRLGLGGSDTSGTGFHYGATAVFFSRWFKLEAGGGLVFAQTDEWAYTELGMCYEGKRGFMTGLAWTPSYTHLHKAYTGGAQFTLGWRF